MEEAMCSFYSSNQQPLSKPAVGQLVAVRGDDRDEMARGQVMEVMAPHKVKVMSLLVKLFVLYWCQKLNFIHCNSEY